MIIGTAVRSESGQKLAEIHPDGVSIRDRRHGEHHEVKLSPREFLEHVSGTTSAEGIIQHIRGLLIW